MVWRRAEHLVLSGILGTMLVGIAMNGVTAAQPTHPPSVSGRLAVTPSRTIKVTEADNGHRYRLHKGDGLDVQLSGPSSLIWTEPTSSNQAVLQRTGGSSGATATGTFVAIAKGKVQVTADGSPNCSGACPMLILQFQISVSVVG